METRAAPTIVIVGGVAAGASAATRARRMNEHAKVILLERDEHVSFANCGLPYYIGGEIAERSDLLVATPELFASRFAIDVRTMHEVTEIDRSARVVRGIDRRTGAPFEQAWDKLILATGASPIVPSLDGVDAPNVFVLRNLADTDALKAAVSSEVRRAVVVGAGFIGLEMVEQLAHLGVEVSLVELQPQVLPQLDPEMARIVEEELVRRKITLHLGDSLEALETRAGRVVAARLASGARLETDLVVLGIGVRPNTSLAREAGLALGPSGGIVVDAHLRTSDPDVYAAGDAVEYEHGVLGEPMRIPLAGPANRSGRLAGEHAATGESAPMAAVLGTSIVRVFGVTAGMTGLSLKQAQRAGREATAIFVEGKHHAGYFPGAESMTLKMVYAPADGRLLGLQAIGGDGVDKRLDVFSALLQTGSTVEALTELDLAYAPPFGSARDPLHQLGFVATNARAEKVRFVPPDVALGDEQVIDVRTEGEWNRGHLEGAIHIPVDQLRDGLDKLDPRRPTVVVCRSGMRAWIAARILSANGFADVTVMTGGMAMRNRTGRGALDPDERSNA